MQSRTIALVGYGLWPSDLRQLPLAYGASHHFVSKGAGR